MQEGVPPRRVCWPSAEHYFQAGKFQAHSTRERVRLAPDARNAKALGRSLSPLAPRWDTEIKYGRMRRAFVEKLWAHPSARLS